MGWEWLGEIWEEEDEDEDEDDEQRGVAHHGDVGARRAAHHRHRTDAQRAEGQFVELRDGAPVRLRPWSIRYCSPRELDAMAAAAGLALHERWEDFARQAFTLDSPRHVSVYGRPT